jgi:hypothetical protein
MGELNIFNKEIYSYLLLMQWLIVYYLGGWNIIDSGEQRGERWQVKKYLFKWKMCERWEIWNSSNKWWITFLSMWKVTGDISVKAMAAVPPHTHPAPPLSHHHGPLPKSRRDGNGATSLKKTANLTEPSGWIVAGDVVVRAMAAELVLQSYFLRKKWDGAAGRQKLSWRGTVCITYIIFCLPFLSSVELLPGLQVVFFWWSQLYAMWL